MSKVCVSPLGQLFGFGLVSLSVFACAGSAFQGSAPDASATDTGGTGGNDVSGDKVLPRGEPPKGTSAVGGTTTGGTGSSAHLPSDGGDAPSDGGEPSVEPGAAGGVANGGSHAGAAGTANGGSAGNANGGSAGNANGGSAGNANGGAAGEPNPPDPTCNSPLSEDWSHAIGAKGSSAEWQVEWGDPYVDVANHRLVITYDDVAGHAKAYAGGYYVATTVTLENGTVLTPYPYSNEMAWPSLRRSSNGANIELGQTKYGVSEAWTSQGWPAASGAVVPATHQAKLTTYVKAGAQAVASKVEFGGKVYRSAWVSGFTWPNTNLGIMRYVGENNSAVYSGDAVYVGPLSGCQQLSDEAIAELYAK